MKSITINYPNFKENPNELLTKSFIVKEIKIDETKEILEDINNFVYSEIIGQYKEGVHIANTFVVIILRYPVTTINNVTQFTFNLDTLDEFDIKSMNN